MTNATPTSNGLGFGTVLFLIFLVLKLTGYVTWSWWWVFSPLWIPIGLVVLVLGVMTLAVTFRNR